MVMKRLFKGPAEALRAPLIDVALATPRLALRPLAPTDADALAAHLSDETVTRWLARVPHPYGRADAEAFVEHARLAGLSGTAVTLALAPREGAAAGGLIGVVAVHGLDAVPEFGYWLGKAHWGRGLMTEAAGALLDWTYGALPVDRMVSGAFVGNAASLTIQARLGFRRVGISRRPCLARGGPVGHVDTELDRPHYEAARARRCASPESPA